MRFEDVVHTVVGIQGVLVRLADEHGVGNAMFLPALMASRGFEILGAGSPRRLPAGLLDGVPQEVARQALWWHRHMTELLTGLPPQPEPGAVPHPEYDPFSTTLTERETAKAMELSRESGRPVSVHTVRYRRRRYQKLGILGMVDARHAPRRTAFGRVDPQVADILARLIGQATDTSTHTVSYYFTKVARELEGSGVAMPSRATFYRLFSRLEGGRHTTGSARTRRSLANRPQEMFEQAVYARPGELMEIDSTPFDVMVRLDDGVAARVELTGLVDLATRSIPAAVLRPSTKSVDAALLLARAVTPATMRPGWPRALRMEYSALPYQRMLSIDERLEHAAAVPPIIPEAIVVDGGHAFVSRNFQTACDVFGTEVIYAPPRTPTHKPHIERTLGSAASLFAQYLTGYTGRSAEYRGRDVECERLWPLHQVQELLEQWLSAVWQNRAHDGLRDPLAPRRAFSPNEKYAALVQTAGYLPLALTAEDYLELLPSRWQAVNSYGIKITHRVYDCAELGTFRRQKSGIAAHKDRWEIKYDPYDVRLVWLRDHRRQTGQWITVPWRLLGHTATPFGELAWDHAARDLRDQGQLAGEDEIARAVSDLLHRAGTGPDEPAGRVSRREAKVAARTRATAEPSWPRAAPPDHPEPETPQAEQGEDEADAVVPLPVFDPYREAEKRW